MRDLPPCHDPMRMSLDQRAVKDGDLLKLRSWAINLLMDKGTVMMFNMRPLGGLNEFKLVCGNFGYTTPFSKLDKTKIADSWTTLVMGAMGFHLGILMELGRS